MSAENKDSQENADGDTILLNYQDACCLYGRDLFLLEDAHGWLNADLVYFGGRWLQDQDQSASDNFLFLDPSVVSFFMHQLDLDDLDEARDFTTTLQNQLQDKTLVLIPVNNVMGTSAWSQPHQGQHWSLLVLILLDQYEGATRCWHVDSIEDSGNAQAAVRVAEQWQRIMKKPTDAQSLPDAVTVQQVPSVPQQINGYDCGVHVLAAAATLFGMTEQQRATPEHWGQVIAAHLQRQSIAELRQFLATAIRRLAKDKKEVASLIDI